MAVTIDWASGVISVNKIDMTMISATLYELDSDVFRKALNALQADVDGMPFLHTHNHSTIITVGGTTLARVIEIINGYTITFEDGQYAVTVVGANTNIADVMNLNQVSLRTNNSAGLIEANLTPSGIANAVWGALTSTYADPGTFGEAAAFLQVEQLWNLKRTPSDSFIAAFSINKNGQAQSIPGAARLAFVVTDSAGTVQFTQTDVSPVGDTFHISEAFTPTAGTNYIAVATVTNAPGTVSSVRGIGIPEI